MLPLVECVPNFSEGRNSNTISAIGAAVQSVAGVKLLSVEPDKDYNRTVVTFVGSPDAVVEAAFQSTRVASEFIDMSQHKGEHPRIGCADVVPFVPVSGISMQECVQLANRYGKRVGEELGIPIFLYEEAATRPERRNLATIRRGEYEGLAAKLQDPAWQPDYGPAVFNARSGATVTGARMFLIAYNVNLSTNDPAIAHDIALHIRESGRVKKDDQGKAVVDDRGQKVMIPGSLKAVKAMGVLLEAHDIAQVSINLVNFHITPPHVAFEEVKREAVQRGIRATGSEIVGLTPKDALLVAGRFYEPEVHEERASIDVAIEHLGLDQLDRFDVRKKIIEYQLEG